MRETTISQTEADALIALSKKPTDPAKEWNVPDERGGAISIPLLSLDEREAFHLDIWRSKVILTKGRYQNRARQGIILVRLDFGGAPHRNPDDREIGTPHLHVYREGYDDKWAFDVPIGDFPNINDMWKTISNFMKFCNITQKPILKRGLL